MGKYDPLMEFLRGENVSSLEMDFGTIESIIDQSLPRSARLYRAWWSNEDSGTHVQSRSWLAAGWRVADVDLTNHLVIFEVLG
jgi:hypothetical protein